MTDRGGPPGPWRIAALSGELDLVTASVLEERIDQLIALAAPPPRIALEMSQLSFCDSSGLNTLVRLWRSSRPSGEHAAGWRAPAPARRR